MSGVRAQVGSISLLCNTDFEDSTVVSPGSYTILHQNAVPCWKTTATDKMIEVWGAGFNGVQPHSGSQFIELNANMVSTIYQEFTPVPASTVVISFAHRGRSGTDVMAVEIGPVGGPYTSLGTFSAGNSVWVFNTVNFTFPAGISGTYALRFNSVSGAGGSVSIGNFLDDINITLTVLGTTVTSTSPACHNSTNGTIQVNPSGGTPPYQYLWSNGYTGGSTQTGLASGLYTVTVTDLNGLSSIDTVSIPAVLPLTVGTQHTNPTCHGSSDGSVLSSISGGTAPYTVAWAGIGANSLQVNNLSAGTYPYTVTDANGCITSGSATLVQPAPLSVSSQSSNPSCHGSANGAILSNVSGGTAPYTTSWTGPGMSMNGTQLTNLVAGNYNYTVKDANWCTTSGLVSLAQPAALMVTSQVVHPVCHGSSDGSILSSIAGGTAPYAMNWTGIGSTSPQANNLPAGTYPYTVTDANGCTVSGMEMLANPAPIAVTVSALPNRVCEGQPVLLTATGGLNYSWSNGATGSGIETTPNQTQSYGVIASDAAGCTGAATVQVQVDPLPSLRVFSDSMCMGETYVPAYQSSIASGSIVSTLWDFGDKTNSPSTAPRHRYNFSGSYTVQCTVTSDRQCTNSAEAVVRVHANPHASFDVVSAEGCAPVTASLVNTSYSTDGGIVSHVWTSPEAEEVGSNQFRFDTPGSHAVLLTITSEYGCKDDTLVQAVAIVHPRAKAGFDFYTDELSDNTTILVVTDRSENAITWSWDFGDGGSSNDANPVHSYESIGVQQVRQIVDNGYGCPDTMTKNIVVGPPSSLWAPNAFSPNGDGLNEVFTAYGTRIESFRMDIFDRNGELIFNTTDIVRGWDGTVQGEPAQEDVYIYAITYSNISRTEKQLTGRFTLVR